MVIGPRVPLTEKLVMLRDSRGRLVVHFMGKRIPEKE